MTMVDRCLPPWMPPENTVRTVQAGTSWDAVIVPQHVGLAALSVLDTETDYRPGPVIWDTGRSPRLYFLIPASTPVDFTDTPGRRISTGCHIAVPGPTSVEPPGPYWVSPPDPDQPDRLMDPELLAAALRRVVGAAWVEYRPDRGEVRQLLVVTEQLHGRVCILCHATEGLVPAGHAFTNTRDSSAPLGWPVAACPGHASALAGDE